MSLEKKERISVQDEATLAELGYKQEFKRTFTLIEVCDSFLLESSPYLPSNDRHLESPSALSAYCRRWRTFAHPFSVCFLQIYSIFIHRSVLFYAIPNGGPVAMVWGVCTICSTPVAWLTDQSFSGS